MCKLRVCDRLLGVTEPKTALDAAIINATGLDVVDELTDSDEKMIDQLRRRVSELETQLGDVTRDASDLQRQLDERDTQLAQLRRIVHDD